MHHDLFVETLQDRTGLANPEDAKHVIGLTLEVVGECLIDIDRRAIAARLPDPFAEILESRRYQSDVAAEELFERIRARVPGSSGSTVEHAQVVFQLVGECLDSDTRTLLEKHLPGDIADLFAVRPRTTGANPHVAPRMPDLGRPPTLSEGRPGSHRPLAEARDDRAHSDSVARSDNPHADTKLSSTRGISAPRTAVPVPDRSEPR